MISEQDIERMQLQLDALRRELLRTAPQAEEQPPPVIGRAELLLRQLEATPGRVVRPVHVSAETFAALKEYAAQRMTVYSGDRAFQIVQSDNAPTMDIAVCNAVEAEHD